MDSELALGIRARLRSMSVLAHSDRPQSEPRTDATRSAAPPSESQPTSLVAQIAGRTDVGTVREHNEDNFLIGDITAGYRCAPGAELHVETSHVLVLAVCDGMGGAAAGEVASQVATDTLHERLVSALAEQGVLDRDAWARELVRAVEAAGERIFLDAAQNRNRRGMGTTMTAALIAHGEAIIAQIGDSRAYVLKEGSLVQLTRDQSLLAQLLENGQLSEEDAKTFEHSNIILQALGTTETVDVAVSRLTLTGGELLLLCSDGLSGALSHQELQQLASHPREPAAVCELLLERANRQSGHDNATVVIARFGVAPDDREPPAWRPSTTGDGARTAKRRWLAPLLIAGCLAGVWALLSALLPR